MAAKHLIHLVDDDASFRTAVSRLLRIEGYEVAEYGSAKQFLDASLPDKSGCILLDVLMPGFSGLELQSHLSKRGSFLPIVFLTGHQDTATTVKAIKAGAEDFLPKPVPRAKLLRAVEDALSHYEKDREKRSEANSLEALLQKLTARETEVFSLVVQGKLNKQIAHQLGTSVRTIKAHRQSIMKKIGVNSIAELVAFAGQLGKIPTIALRERKS